MLIMMLFCFGQAPVNKLVSETSLLWALQKSRVYDYDYDRGEAVSHMRTMEGVGRQVGPIICERRLWTSPN